MSTQEKLEQKIFNLVYQWGRVGIVADHTAPTYVAYIQELIDSAKREAELEWQIDQTTELARQNFMYRCLYGEAPLEYKGVNTLVAYQTYREGDDFRKNFARYVEQLAKELEQSEEGDK